MIKSFIKLIKESYRYLVEDRVSMMAGSLAYFELLSLAPMVAVVTFGATKLRADNKILIVIDSLFPPKYLEVVKFLLIKQNNINQYQVPTLTIVSLISLYLSVSYFATLKDSIEIIWNRRTEETGFKNRLRKKWEDFRFTIFAILILFLFIMVRSYIPVSEEQADTITENIIFPIIRSVMISIFFFLLLLYVLRFAPPIRPKWTHILPGAFLASILQAAGRGYMIYYLEGTKVSENTAEILVVLLIWFYYSNLMFLFCAEFTKAYLIKKEALVL